MDDMDQIEVFQQQTGGFWESNISLPRAEIENILTNTVTNNAELPELLGLNIRFTVA